MQQIFHCTAETQYSEKELMLTLPTLYSVGHHVLELYNILVQIRLTTSKTKRDI